MKPSHLAALSLVCLGSLAMTSADHFAWFRSLVHEWTEQKETVVLSNPTNKHPATGTQLVFQDANNDGVLEGPQTLNAAEYDSSDYNDPNLLFDNYFYYDQKGLF